MWGSRLQNTHNHQDSKYSDDHVPHVLCLVGHSVPFIAVDEGK
jgi:hypothetical protein